MADSPLKFFGLFDDFPKDRVMTNGEKIAWTEDNFHYSQVVGRNDPLPETALFAEHNITNKKIWLFLSFFGLFFLLIFSRMFWLQVIKGDKYRAMAESNRRRNLPISAERGTIYDSFNIPLTQNIPKFAIALVPQDLPRDDVEREKVVTRLAELTNQEPQSIHDTLDEFGSYSYESIVIKEDIDYETALSIQIAAADLPGIHIQRGSKREYLFSGDTTSSLSHVLGYQGKLNRRELDQLYSQGYLPSDYIGKIGVEKIYETALRGIAGKRAVEVNAAGKEQTVLAEEAPVPGQHVKLSIDQAAQNKLEQIISESLIKNHKARASGIVMNPNNGEIIALVSLPSYNNNDFSGGIDQTTYLKYISNLDHPLFNRAISGEYPSGSTIKPAIAAAALAEGIVKEKTSISSVGGIKVGDHFFPDWLAGGHGATNVTKAIAWSVNTFFYYVGGGYKDFTGLGVDRIVIYLKKFGLASKLGIDLPGEATGFLPSKEWKEKTKGERWYVGDTYNLSIGQGDLLVTPLQIASITATVANGGTVYQPRVVDELINPIDQTSTKIANKIINQKFLSPGDVNIVQKGMRECVTKGSCQLLSYLSFTSAGKTGTAQWNSTKENHAWFTSYAPYEKPQIVVTILVEEGGEGSRVAMPITFEFYKWWGQNRKK